MSWPVLSTPSPASPAIRMTRSSRSAIIPPSSRGVSSHPGHDSGPRNELATKRRRRDGRRDGLASWYSSRVQGGLHDPRLTESRTNVSSSSDYSPALERALAHESF